MDQDFMNQDEIKRDENGQNMFVRSCLIQEPVLGFELTTCEHQSSLLTTR